MRREQSALQRLQFSEAGERVLGYRVDPVVRQQQVVQVPLVAERVVVEPANRVVTHVPALHRE